MDEKGVAERTVLQLMKEHRKRDVPFGRVLSSMCTRPHPLAIKAHMQYIETNLGDPYLFPGTKEVENNVVGMLGKLLGAPCASGYITTGGTESNIQALRVARNLRRIPNPNIIIPESAHFSFDKAADVLGLELKKASLDEHYRVCPASVEDLIDESTVALVGIAGTTEFGQIDPIDELAELALSSNVYLHVDAAFGGLVIPFLDKKHPFDFGVEGVSSIMVDPHKMGAGTIPSSGLLFRHESHMEKLATSTPYLVSKKQHSLTGTRTGASIAATYAIFKHFGYEGYRRIVKHCMNLTSTVEKWAEKFGIETFIKPVTNIVVLRIPSVDTVVPMLEERNWYVSTTPKPKGLRLVMMPHMTEETLNIFLADLGDVIEK